MYGQVTGDWAQFNNAWAIDGEVHHPVHADQPTNSFYNPSKPATYAPEYDLPSSSYPSPLDTGVTRRAGPDRRRAEDRLRHRRHLRHALAARRRQHLRLRPLRRRHHHGPPTSTPSSAARRSRSGRPSRSRPATRSSTAARTATWTCSSRTPRYAKQWKYTNAPDADARAVQAAYWALTWAKAQGKAAPSLGHRRQGRQDGRLPALLDVRQVLQEDRRCTSAVAAPAGTGKDSAALPAVLVLRLGRRDRHHRRLGLADRLQPQPLRLPEPAGGLGAVQRRRRCKPQVGRPARTDWTTSLEPAAGVLPAGCSPPRAPSPVARPTAGTATTRTPPAGTPTFYGMAYDGQPVYHDPPSNQWFGFQAWSMERVAEYYYATGNAEAKAVLDKWVAVGASPTPRSTPTATYQIPSDAGRGPASRDTWNADQPRRQHRPARRASPTTPTTSAWPARYAKILIVLRGQVRQRRGQDHGQGAARRHLAQRPGRQGRLGRRRPGPTTTSTTSRRPAGSTSRRAGPARCPTATPINSGSTFLSHPVLLQERPGLAEGPGVPERRRRADLQLPPVLGPGRRRHRPGRVRPALPVSSR